MIRRRRTEAKKGGCGGWLMLAAIVLGGVWLAVAMLDNGPPPAGPRVSSGLGPVVAKLKSLDPNCAAPSWLPAAEANATSLQTLVWSPWGRPETGWETYVPLVGHEIGSSCAPETEGFAQALSRWQASHGLSPDGRMAADAFEAMRVMWLRRRPFVLAMATGCPAPPADSALVLTDPGETYAGQALKLRPGALDAYRRMVLQARADSPEIASDRRALTIISGYRAPQIGGSDCPPGQTCDRLGRANCSAHRTGLAVDLYLGAAPGSDPASTGDANRLFQSKTPAYRWLVANGARFGFLPYPYEPWHWEWTGEPP